MNSRKTTRNLALIAAFLLGSTGFAKAQSQEKEANDIFTPTSTYTDAIGIRGGLTGGITVKHRFGHNAIEGIADIWHNGLTTRLLLETYRPSGISGLNWYYGAGGHLSFANSNWHNEQNFRRFPYQVNDSELGLGVDGVLGIEYKIPPIPFAISLDLIPQVEVLTDGRVWATINPGLGVKVVF